MNDYTKYSIVVRVIVFRRRRIGSRFHSHLSQFIDLIKVWPYCHLISQPVTNFSCSRTPANLCFVSFLRMCSCLRLHVPLFWSCVCFCPLYLVCCLMCALLLCLDFRLFFLPFLSPGWKVLLMFCDILSFFCSLYFSCSILYYYEDTSDTHECLWSDLRIITVIIRFTS